MALLVLRALFVMVSVGIAVLIFRSQVAEASSAWEPWAVLVGMVSLTLAVIGIDTSIRHKDLTVITAVYFGLVIGAFLTYVSMLALTPILPIDPNSSFRTWLPLILGSILCYICTSLLLQTRDEFRFILPYVEFARDVRGLRPNVLDTTAIVDGRIADLAEAGVFESRFVVPSFVLDDLQTSAESSDRQRPRRAGAAPRQRGDRHRRDLPAGGVARRRVAGDPRDRPGPRARRPRDHHRRERRETRRRPVRARDQRQRRGRRAQAHLRAR
jgi:uncharacterized protein YacL